MPDRDHGTNLTGPKAWLFRTWVRHAMNRRVAAIRAAGGAPACQFAPSGSA